MTVVDLELSPANRTWPQLRDRARRAEDEGYGALWTFDHLAGASLSGSTMLECFTLLGALTEATERIELGTMVANVWNRGIGTLVTAAASVAIMSGRRFHLGLGAGAAPNTRWAFEQDAVDAHVDASLAGRHDRVVRAVELAREQWRGDRDERFATFPLPDPAPTLLIAASGLRLARIAGRIADGINVRWDHPGRDALLDAADAEAGGRPFVRTVYADFAPGLLDVTHPDRRQMAARRIDRLVLADLSSR